MLPTQRQRPGLQRRHVFLGLAAVALTLLALGFVSELQRLGQKHPVKPPSGGKDEQVVNSTAQVHASEQVAEPAELAVVDEAKLALESEQIVENLVRNLTRVALPQGVFGADGAFHPENLSGHDSHGEVFGKGLDVKSSSSFKDFGSHAEGSALLGGASRFVPAEGVGSSGADDDEDFLGTEKEVERGKVGNVRDVSHEGAKSSSTLPNVPDPGALRPQVVAGGVEGNRKFRFLVDQDRVTSNVVLLIKRIIVQEEKDEHYVEDPDYELTESDPLSVFAKGR